MLSIPSQTFEWSNIYEVKVEYGVRLLITAAGYVAKAHSHFYLTSKWSKCYEYDKGGKYKSNSRFN